MCRLRPPFLRTVSWRAGRPETAGYPFDLPCLNDGFRLRFEEPVTVSTGENRAGKSTLLQAMPSISAWDPASLKNGGSRPFD